MAIYKRCGYWHVDVTINRVHYREALHETDEREARRLEKQRIAEIHQGKAASPLGREFARKPFGDAADEFLADRKPHVSERTCQLEQNLLCPLRRFFGSSPLRRIKAADIAAYQRTRRETGISGGR